jgi:3-deoxy-manno-octulosonate cytidylyltransferase (CMP-KDO synthetase)
MKFIAIIPARYSSSRFPGKPLADIMGKPMIQRVYEQASQVFDHIIVATDDERILHAVHNFGGTAVMTSPTHKSGTDRCAEALTIAENYFSTIFDVVVNLQGDEPFIQPEQLKLIQACFNERSVQIATLIKPVHNKEELFDANKPKVVINNKHEAIYFSRSVIPFVRGIDEKEWISHHQFYIHIGIYAFTRETLLKITQLETTKLEKAESLEQLRWIENGFSIKVAVTKHESIGIDTPDDLEKAIKLLNNTLSKPF